MRKLQIVKSITFSDKYSPNDPYAIYYVELYVAENSSWYIIRCTQTVLNQLRAVLKKGGLGWNIIKQKAEIIYPSEKTSSKIEPNLKEEALKYIDQLNEPSNKIKQLLLF